MVVVKKGGLLSADEAHALIEPVIIELFDETMLDPRTDSCVGSALGFTPFRAVTKDGQIQTQHGVKGTPLVGEFDSFTMDDDSYGPKIGYDVVRVFPWEGMSSEAKKWIERAGQSSDIPSALREDLAKSISRLARKLMAIKITENEFKTKILTEGFAIKNATGWGSAVIDGQPLFSTNHVTTASNEVYSNIVDGGLAEGNAADSTHAPLTFNSLKYAVRMLREMKDGNGVRIRRPRGGVYDLYVSVEGEENALNILSDENGYSVYKYDGTDSSNENQTNTFVTRDGFKVRLNVLETLNQPDSEDTSLKIGNATNWFVMNKEEAMKRGAIRDIEFGDVSVEVFYDSNKKATFLTAEKHFGAQPMYAEVIVGSKGDGSAIA